MDIFWVHNKIGLYLGIFLCILVSSLKVKVQNGGYFFGVAKISNIFWGCLKFLIFLWVEG